MHTTIALSNLLIRTSLRSGSVLVLASALSLVGCDDGGSNDGAGGDDSSDDGDTGGTGGGSTDDTIDSWLGSDPHVEIVGTVAGKTIDFSVSESEASDLGTAYCERNYIEPPSGDLYLEKIEIKYNLVYEDQFAEFQLEVVNPELTSSVGETLTIGGDTEVNVGLTLAPDEPTEEEFEDVATGGNVTIGAVGGTPTDGVIPDGEGSFGVHFDVTLESGGTLSGSFTVNCGDNDIEPEEA